jgi:hypothetical protein
MYDILTPDTSLTLRHHTDAQTLYSIIFGFYLVLPSSFYHYGSSYIGAAFMQDGHEIYF